MTVYAPTVDPGQLTQLHADVDQLTQPWRYQVLRERVWWDRNRNRKTTQWVTWELRPPLLDLLAAAVERGHAPRGPERRARPGSATPVNLDAIARQQAIRGHIAQWCAELDYWPATLDTTAWAVQALRALNGRAPKLDRTRAEQLIRDVHTWWGWCAKQAGYDPDELLDQR